MGKWTVPDKTKINLKIWHRIAGITSKSWSEYLMKRPAT